MTGLLQPLVKNQAIVGPDGRPTDYFIRWAQQRQIDIAEAITAEQALEIVTQFIDNFELQSGSGISITPDGKLTSNPTISAEAQAILNQISDVHGTVLFRGASDWEGLAPGTPGEFLQTNGPGADPEWGAGGGGGGSYPSLTYPVASNFPILINSPTVVDNGVGVSITGATANPAIRAIMKTLPSGNFITTIRVTGDWGAGFNRSGIVFRDTANKFLTVGPLSLNTVGKAVEISQWSDSITFVSGVAFRELDNANNPEWIRCAFDASTNDVTASVSWDGFNFLTLGTSTYLDTVDAVGIGIGLFSLTRAPWASFSSYTEA